MKYMRHVLLFTALASLAACTTTDPLVARMANEKAACTQGDRNACAGFERDRVVYDAQVEDRRERRAMAPALLRNGQMFSRGWAPPPAAATAPAAPLNCRTSYWVNNTATTTCN